jgi:hypothetical protein
MIPAPAWNADSRRAGSNAAHTWTGEIVYVTAWRLAQSGANRVNVSGYALYSRLPGVASGPRGG